MRIILLLVIFNITLIANTKISKIKIIGNSYTKTETILSFFREVKVGKSYPKNILNENIKKIENRLLKTTWFYDVDIYAIKSLKREDYTNIIVEVKEGFLQRYWGGSIYAGFGYANLNGTGSYIAGELGSNRKKIYYNNPLFLHPDFLLEFSAGLIDKESVLDNDKYIEYKETELFLAYQTLYDNIFGINILIDKNKLSSNINKKIGVRYRKDTRDDFFSSNNGNYLNFFIGKSTQFNLMHYEFDYRHYFEITDNITYAIKLLYNKQSKNSSNFYDFYSLHGINKIRSSESENLYGDEIKIFQNEIRIDSFKNSILNIESALFLDLGSAKFNNRTTDAYAYGLALRCYVNKPVYLPIRLELGFNKDQTPTLFFGVEHPF